MRLSINWLFCIHNCPGGPLTDSSAKPGASIQKPRVGEWGLDTAALGQW